MHKIFIQYTQISSLDPTTRIITMANSDKFTITLQSFEYFYSFFDITKQQIDACIMLELEIE